MNKKRIRSVNWDEEEKQLLRYILRDHAHVIENKAINTKTIKLKNKAWEEVFKRFNELNGRHRNIIQLKIQWKTMKLNARKRRKVKREPVEATSATPSDAVIAIKHLLNPAERLKQNLYDSDEIGLKPMAFVDTCLNDNINQDNQQIADCIEIIENIDAQVDTPKIYVPLRISKDIFKNTTQMEKNMNTIPAKKVLPKQQVISDIPENGLTYRKDHDHHVSSMISHIKMLKEDEYRRRLEMAEEEHSLKIAIQIEKLKSATLEREILELKKAREESLNPTNESLN